MSPETEDILIQFRRKQWKQTAWFSAVLAPLVFLFSPHPLIGFIPLIISFVAFEWAANLNTPANYLGYPRSLK